MRHIRYMKDGQTVCNYPDRLDLREFIMLDQKIDMECQVCWSLLYEHQRKVKDPAWRELSTTHNEEVRKSSIELMDLEYRALMRGLVGGVAVASGFWIAVILMLWYFWQR